MAIRIGTTVIRPGKSKHIDDSLLTEKVKALQGTRIWIGDLPGRFTRTSQSAQKVKIRTLTNTQDPPMDIAAARTYLEQLDEDVLLSLCESVVPPLEFAVSPAKSVLVARLGRVLFMPDRTLDPEKFFWLRRWIKQGDIFVERE
jgi:hypothetical protein